MEGNGGGSSEVVGAEKQSSSYTYWVRTATDQAAPLPVPRKLTPQEQQQDILFAPSSIGSVWNKAGTWEEKNLNSWATARIKELMVAVGLEFSNGKAAITEVSRCVGDAFLVTVRNKKRVGYTYELTLKFKGEWLIQEEIKKITGQMDIPEFSFGELDDLQDAVGAINGTHFDANIPIEDQNRYRNRKGNVSQNVLVAVLFDMKFTYVLAGWEGSAHDGRVLRSVVTHEGRRLTLPQRKYYLADASYANMLGFLTPYRGVRYHLKQYNQEGGHQQPQNVKELFNLCHSSLHNVVERTIGVLKCRWAYLRHPTFHDVHTQSKIIVACCALHNFLWCVASDDDDISCTSSDSDTFDDDEDDIEPNGEEGADYDNLVIAPSPQWTLF